MTDEQRRVVEHNNEVSVTACPGAGKTRTIVDRVVCLAQYLPPRKGIGVLSFTHSAVDTFIERCRKNDVEMVLRHPSFIGTFDSFIRQFLVLPGGIVGVNSSLFIVDSWDSLSVEIRLSGRNAFNGAGVSLDKFDPLNNNIDPSTIGHAGLRQHVIQNQQAYVRAATLYRTNLKNKGYLSTADARILAAKNLENFNWATSLGRALKGRFHEIIVDEAQDCNPEDIKVLQWLRDSGIRVTLVCDPDQAIYEFRHGDPAVLRSFSATYDVNNQLPMTGNFRSSPAICFLAATLRQRTTPDNSLGDYASVTYPVQIISYQGQVTEWIGNEFMRIVDRLEPDLKERVILSHSTRHGLQAAGDSLSSDSGNSRVALMARIVSEFRSPSSSNRKREAVLQNTEKIILGLMGKIDVNEHPGRAAERNGINKRELRRQALELIVSLPPTFEDSDQGRLLWFQTLLSTVERLSLEFPPGGSVRRFFPTPRNSSWAECLLQSTPTNCPRSTIHQVKGKEFKAVCVVIPPDRAPSNNTSNLFQAWENRIDDEAKRVIYVGATRAQKILVIAIPEAFRSRLVNILNVSNVPYI